MENLPLVTVGTLCYNSSEFVIETLESVKNQTYPNIQHIIIDDCSTDGTAEKVQEWIDQNSYDCIYIARDKNKGVHAGNNEVLDLAEGEYIAFVAGDDIWVDRKTEEQVKLLENADDDCILVYSNMNYIDDFSKPITLEANDSKEYSNFFSFEMGGGYNLPSGDVFLDYAKKYFFLIQSCLIDLKKLESLNFRFKPEFTCEDQHVSLHMTRHFKVIADDEIRGSYRIHNSSLTQVEWKPDKVHKHQLSKIEMLKEVYHFPENNSEEKEIIKQRILNVAQEVFQSQLTFDGKKKLALEMFFMYPSVNTLKRYMMYNRFFRKFIVKK